MRRSAVTPASTLALGGGLLGWVAVAHEMRGMDMGPGTDPGPASWFLWVWLLMTAAMMLPSLAPTFALYARMRGRGAGALALGYGLVWLAFGALAYAAYRPLAGIAPSFTGVALALAGLYQLSPLKERCLRVCRSPLQALVRGGLRAGVTLGVACVGCCAGLMLVLFAVGIMSVAWMAVVSAAVAAEKLLPHGRRVATASGLALVAAGLWVAL